MTHNYDYDEKLNKPNYRLHNRKIKREREKGGEIFLIKIILIANKNSLRIMVYIIIIIIIINIMTERHHYFHKYL